MLEGTTGGLYSNLQHQAGSALRSDRAAQGLVWSSLESLQEWRLHRLSGLQFQCLTVLTVEKVSPSDVWQKFCVKYDKL